MSGCGGGGCGTCGEDHFNPILQGDDGALNQWVILTSSCVNR